VIDHDPYFATRGRHPPDRPADDDPAYTQNQLRQDLWRAGHAHAGVLPWVALAVVVLVAAPALAAVGAENRTGRASVDADALGA
jgi:hypothetical protein